MSYVYHITLKKDWEAAQETGTYTTSTLNKTFKEVGFIHLSYRHQIPTIAKTLYSKIKGPLIVLTLDTAKMQNHLFKRELSGNSYFPHYYGPIYPKYAIKTTPLEKFIKNTPL